MPYRINPRRNTPRHLLIKLRKIKYKEQILKAAKVKQQIIYKGIPIRLIADVSTETKVIKGKKTYNQDYSIQGGSYSDLKKKSKAFR